MRGACVRGGRAAERRRSVPDQLASRHRAGGACWGAADWPRRPRRTDAPRRRRVCRPRRAGMPRDPAVIVETIVTSVGEDGAINVAPMGVEWGQGSIVLKPFLHTATYRNVLATRV